MGGTQIYDDKTMEYDGARNDRRRALLEPIFFKALGDIDGKSVLDMACGTGYSTRLLFRHGIPSNVLGVDISTPMIEEARRQEDLEEHGIAYKVGNALDYFEGVQYDIVTAYYLLTYANTRNELNKMCQMFHKNVKEGGRIVTVTNIYYENCRLECKNLGYHHFPRTKDPKDDPDVLKTYLTLTSAEKAQRTTTIPQALWTKDIMLETLKLVGFECIEFFSVVSGWPTMVISASKKKKSGDMQG